jgi:hypothetical protein
MILALYISSSYFYQTWEKEKGMVNKAKVMVKVNKVKVKMRANKASNYVFLLYKMCVYSLKWVEACLERHYHLILSVF